MVYNPFKKEHRYMYAVPTSLDGVRMAAQHAAMYFEKTYLSLGGKENENSKEGWKRDAKPIPEPIALDNSKMDINKLQIKKGKKEDARI